MNSQPSGVVPSVATDATPNTLSDETAVDRFMREVFSGERKPTVTEYALALRARAEKSLRLDAESTIAQLRADLAAARSLLRENNEQRDLLIHLGTLFSNVAYNFAQLDDRPTASVFVQLRDSLSELRLRWDAALKAYRATTLKSYRAALPAAPVAPTPATPANENER